MRPRVQPVAAFVPSGPLDYEAMREAPPLDVSRFESWQPPRQRRSLLPALLFLILVIGACFWALWDDLMPPMVVEIPVPPPPAAEKLATAPVIPLPELDRPTASAALTSAPPVPVEPPKVEMRRAEIPKTSVNLAQAGEAGQRLFLELLEAASAETRARLIDQPEEYSADVEEFFAKGKPQLRSFKPSNATPFSLPGHETVPLFQVTTRENPNGALLRLVPQKDGSFLLDWPLFAETHQRRLGDFLEKKPTDPAWFQVGMRRSHALELSGEVRALQVAFTLQGAADSSVSCLGIAQKNTPIGRYLDHETEWSTIYLARLLLQHRKLEDGTWAVVILDCEGAATAADLER